MKILSILFNFCFFLWQILNIILFFIFFIILFLLVWQVYFQVNVFFKKIEKFLIYLKNWWDFLFYVVKSFKIVLTYMFEIFIYDILIFVVGLIFYAFYKLGRAVLTYDMFLDLVVLRCISDSLINFNKLSFIIGLFFFQMVFLVIIYLQLKKVVKLLVLLDIDKLLPYLVLLFSTANCYLLFFILKKTYFIQHNFLFVTAPLVYLSIYILIFYFFLFYFICIQLLFFIFKGQYPKIKNYFLVQDFFYFLCYLLIILVIFNYSFFFWLFLPLDHKLEESDLLDFLEKYVINYKEILLGQEFNKENTHN